MSYKMFCDVCDVEPLTAHYSLRLEKCEFGAVNLQLDLCGYCADQVRKAVGK